MRSLRSPSVVHLFQKADVGQHATKASDSLQVLALLQNEADTSTAFRIGVEPWGIPNDCGGRARPTWFRDFCAPRPISPVFFLLNDSPISTSSCFMVELGAMRGLIHLIFNPDIYVRNPGLLPTDSGGGTSRQSVRSRVQTGSPPGAGRSSEFDDNWIRPPGQWRCICPTVEMLSAQRLCVTQITAAHTGLNGWR
jgi:hypothetical protein